MGNFLKETLKDSTFKLIKAKNNIKRVFSKDTENVFLFILCPPYSGSTILHQFLDTSKNVSRNNPFGTREGQTLPTVRHMMWPAKQRWNDSFKFDWDFIKNEWLKYWDTTKKVLMEKSPANILRAFDIENIFDPIFFIIMVRNPYAHAEGLMRRNTIDATRAANFVIKCLKFQKENKDKLPNSLFFTYEDFTDNTPEIKNKILDFLPQISDLDERQGHRSHRFRGKAKDIINMNNNKIAKLSPQDIEELNKIFKQNADLFEYFGYDFIS